MEIKCDQCGSLFSKKKNRILKSKNHFCKRVCFFTFLKETALSKVINGIKRCSKCKLDKPLDKFGTDRKFITGKHPQCNDCINDRNRFGSPSFDVKKNSWLKYHYGITYDTYNSMLELQNGLCKICSRPEKLKLKGKLKMLAVDHCHNTGKIRGLLCSNCNRGIGMLEENLDILNSAIKYLTESRF